MSRSILVLSTLFPPAVGGAETYARILVEGLLARGDDILLVTDHLPGSHRAGHVIELSRYLERLKSPDLARLEQLYFGVLPEIFAAVAQRPTPDVIFANSMDMAVVGRMIATTLQRPLIVNYHEHAPEEEPFGAGRARLAYQDLRPDAIIAGSQFYERRALRFGAQPADVHLIHHGVDLARHAAAEPDRPQIRRELGLADDQVLVLSSGRFKDRKNQKLLIRAFAAASPTLTAGAVILLAGSTSSASAAYLTELLDECAAFGIADRVIVRKDLSYDDMASYNAAADIAAIPSREEGLGFAVLEAMASGVAVLTAAVPGISEIVAGAECAWLAADDDPTSWSEGLTQLVNDTRSRRRLGRIGREHVAANFAADLMVQRTGDLIDMVCDR
jgi:glycosyltransferase involved in cell wall biosynthesis